MNVIYVIISVAQTPLLHILQNGVEELGEVSGNLREMTERSFN